jgi:ferredoxin
MPKLTVDGYGTFEVPAEKRLVLAIEQDAKVDILHACGGNARCTTCRVEFIEGEPSSTPQRKGIVSPSAGWASEVVVSNTLRPRHGGPRDQPSRRLGTSGPGFDTGADDHAAAQWV